MDFFFHSKKKQNINNSMMALASAFASTSSRPKRKWTGAMTKSVIKTKYEPFLRQNPRVSFSECIVRLSQFREEVVLQTGVGAISPGSLHNWARSTATDQLHNDLISKQLMVQLLQTKSEDLQTLKERAYQYRRDNCPRETNPADIILYKNWATRMVQNSRYLHTRNALFKRSDDEPEYVGVDSLDVRLEKAEKKARLEGNFVDLS